MILQRWTSFSRRSGAKHTPTVSVRQATGTERPSKHVSTNQVGSQLGGPTWILAQVTPNNFYRTQDHTLFFSLLNKLAIH